jgi:hypothetical protein
MDFRRIVAPSLDSSSAGFAVIIGAFSASSWIVHQQDFGVDLI